MEDWLKISLILCLFGFLKEFRPSESFAIAYLIGPQFNLTNEKISQSLYPVGNYTYMSLQVVILLITDILRYKPLIVLCGISAVCSWSFLSFGRRYWALVLAQITYGVFQSTEVAYFTYTYARVDKEHYQQVTSHTRTAYLLGHASSALLAQVLVSTGVAIPLHLHYITIGAEILAFFWAVLLPLPKRSLYFHPEDSLKLSSIRGSIGGGENSEEIKIAEHTFLKKGVAAYKLLWKDFLLAYTNLYVVKWSLWWALAFGCFLQVTPYIQMLWGDILEENNQPTTDLYNGAVEAVCTLAGSAASLACGWLRIDWEDKGDAVLAVCSLLQGVMLYLCATSHSLWMSYTYYCVFVISFQAMITINNSEVARHISEDSYGLIFGVNTFFTSIILSLVTFVVTSENGLALASRSQYIVYGGFYAGLGVMYAGYAVISKLFISRRKIYVL